MSIRVKIARQPHEIKNLLSIRHRVMVEEDGHMLDQGGYIVDVYDALPTTVNFIALDGDAVIGGVQLTVDGETGMASDDYFDFRPLLPSESRLISCNLLCLCKAYRDNLKLLTGLIMMGAYWATAQEATHLCAPLDPSLQDILQPIGFRSVGVPTIDTRGLPAVPMVMELTEMSDAFIDFIGNQQIGMWIESFEHEFYAPGEVIIEQGTRGSRAYVLIDGDIAIHSSHNGPEYLAPTTVEKGQLFGELALLTDLERSATVSARSEAEVMVLDRETFQQQLENSPQMAIALLRQVGARFHDTIRAMEEAPS